MLRRWRILDRSRQNNERILDALDELTQMDADHFHDRLREVRALWDEHDQWQRAMLYEPAVVRTMKGADVVPALEADHRAFSTVLSNLERSIGDIEEKLDRTEVELAARRELHSMRIELARHMRHDERQVIRPMMRGMSPAERKQMLKDLEPVSHRV